MTAALSVVTPWLPAMLVLIVLSALFSGSEAALFSLSTRDRRILARGTAGPRAAARLLDQPERLLSTVLFWNLSINMVYFAIVSVVGGRLRASESGGETGELIFAAAALVTIIFFSEMLPKSLGVISPLTWSSLVGLPLALAVRVVAPILPVVTFANLMARRLIWPGFKPESSLRIEDLERAIQLSTGDVDLATRERAMLGRLIALGDVRAAEWMRPRSTLAIVEGELTAESISHFDPAIEYIFVADPQTGEIAQAFAAGTARPSHFDDPSDFAEPLVWVPWSARVAAVLDALRDEDRTAAAVVNEYGETIGVLTIDDILDGILRDDLGAAEIELRGPGVWYVDGGVSIRALARTLEIDLPSGRNVTVAGYMQEQNRRFARLGDRCRLGPLELAVEEIGESGRMRFSVQRADDQERPS